MGAQQQAENKKQFLRNDSLLVCSMLAIYGVCILGLIGATLWGLDRRSRQIAREATSTAFAFATEKANATATVVARTTEQAQYDFIDPFIDNVGFWSPGTIDDEYMVGTKAIQGGIYRWDIKEVKQPFVHRDNFRKGYWFEDFDIYIDSQVKVADGTSSAICSGFVFRTNSFYWDAEAYIFSVCNNSYFDIYYYKQGEREDISGQKYSSAIQNYDWNRLEVSARGDHFSFIINNEIVFEVTDDRLSRGGIALLIEVNEAEPVTIWFDNFGLQSR